MPDFTNGETNFTFTFSSLADDIDNGNLDEIQGRAADWQWFVISQPGRSYEAFGIDEEDWDTVSDRSNQFVVLSTWDGRFIEEQRRLGEEEVFNTWRLGVGIGVGIGVPIFMAGAFVAGCMFGKRRGRRTASMLKT